MTSKTTVELVSPHESGAEIDVENYFEHAPFPFAIVIFDGYFIRINQTCLEIFERPQRQLFEQRVEHFIHPDWMKTWSAELQNAAISGRRASFDLPLQSKDGSAKWLHWDVAPALEQRLFYVVVREISMEVEERELQQARAFVDSLLLDISSSALRACSSNDLLIQWAGVLSRRLNAVHIAILSWDASESCNSRLCWHSGCESELDKANALRRLVEREALFVFENSKPRVHCDFVSDQTLPTELRLLQRHGVQAATLHPLISGGNEAAVLVVFLRHSLTNLVLHAIDSAAREMGFALQRVFAEERREVTNQALANLLESLPAGVAHLDENQRITRWSAGAERIFGWQEAERIGREIPTVSAAQKEQWQRSVRDVIANETQFQFETAVLARNGTAIEATAFVSPKRAWTGTVNGMVAILIDTTNQRNTDRRFALQQAITQVLAESVSVDDAMVAILNIMCVQLGWTLGEFWSIDKEKNVLIRTASWCSSESGADEFDRASREMVYPQSVGLPGRVWSDARPMTFSNFTSDVNEARAHLAARHNLHDAFGLPIRVRDEIGGVLLFLGNKHSELDKAFLGGFTSLADQIGQFLQRIDAQRNLQTAEAAFLQSQKMDAVGLLAGGVAHDFNNLLTVILGHTELLLDEMEPASPLREFAKEVFDAGKRAARLTRQLLAFSRKHSVEPAVFNLNDCIDETQSMLRRLVREDITFQLALAPDLNTVRADPAQIEQLLVNLVVNARDAMPEGGLLTIETRNFELSGKDGCSWPELSPGSYAMLTISDTGCGMDEETRQRIFEPFFTTKPKGQGTGMGLATVYGIVKQSGCQIRVESELGVGTTFTIVFPRVVETLKPCKIEAAPAAIPKGHETILVVEDEVQVRRLISSILNVHEYTVLQAADAAEAIELLTQHAGKIDLILADVIMPGVSSEELIERVLELAPSTRFIFMSGHLDAPVERLKQQGADTVFLEKPFTTYDLTRTIREALDS